MTETLVPAAAYLRRSSGRLEYTTAYQFEYLTDYAARHGFTIVRKYVDEGKTGLTLRGRKGFQQLLSDAMSDDVAFKAILVFDVSRWGRFQDIDEGAFYEHLCRRFGITIHYCSEIFANDGSMRAGVVKSVKRLMSSEYSRHLSQVVHQSQFALAKKGYRQGGPAGYGLRRAAVDEVGKIVAVFDYGQHKDPHYRTVLIPGPSHEVKAVHRIYRLYVEESFSMEKIAALLNNEGVPRNDHGGIWSFATVRQLLSNEKYVGDLVFNRTKNDISGRSRKRKNPSEDWIKVQNAYPAIIDRDLFEKARQLRTSKSVILSDDEALGRLRWLIEQHIMPTGKIISKHPEMPSLTVYRNRFGSLLEAYRRIGYTPISGPSKLEQAAKRRFEHDDLADMGSD